MQTALAQVMAQSNGIISRRDHRDLTAQIDRALRKGELVTTLPGVYFHPEAATDWRARARAVSLWNPNAVVVGEVAAALTFWKDLVPQSVEVAYRYARIARPGFTFSQRIVPAAFRLVRDGITVTHPALTAIDLVPAHDGDAIDRALRTRTATLTRMYEALDATAGRVRNADRRRMLLDSRDEPWSGGERLAHRILREAGITGWRTNVPIVCRGELFYLDIAFDNCPVVIEIDGRVHDQQFDYDRRRGNLLLLEGKQVLHFTWHHLVHEPEWVVEIIRAALGRYR